MHFHVVKAPSAIDKPARHLYQMFGRVKLYSVLPEVSARELAQSSSSCILKQSLIAIMADGRKDIVLNKVGAQYTCRGLFGIMAHIKSRGNSISLDALLEPGLGQVANEAADRFFGPDGYRVVSTRLPNPSDLAALLLVRS